MLVSVSLGLYQTYKSLKMAEKSVKNRKGPQKSGKICLETKNFIFIVIFHIYSLKIRCALIRKLGAILIGKTTKNSLKDSQTFFGTPKVG